MLNEQEKKIDQYLNDEMSEKERQAFEVAIETDAELAKKVAFQKDLTQFFKERNPDLERTLSELGDEFFIDNNEPPSSDKKSSNNKFWMFLLLGMALVTAVGGFFYFNNKGNQPQFDDFYSNPIDAEKAIEKGMLEDGGSEGTIINEVTNPKIDEEEDNEEEVDNEDEEKENTPKSSPPMASVDKENYQPNPMLEGIIRENVRSDGNNFSITSPKLGQTIISKNGIVNLKLKGNSDSERKIKVVLYDNKELSFSNGQYILSSVEKS